MSDKYVVDGELLQELYRAYILQEGIEEPFYVPLEEFKPELINPLTPAQERAGEMIKVAYRAGYADSRGWSLERYYLEKLPNSGLEIGLTNFLIKHRIVLSTKNGVNDDV